MKGEKTSIIGAVVAGGLASACCVGPLLVVLLGLGSAGVFVKMEPLRPLFALITLSLIGIAGFRHVRGRRACAAGGCAPRRPVMLFILGGLALLLLLLPSVLPYIIE